ncbi:hypothetical protein CBS101457_000336 [Exobasidium rhododendri]|nr:hypothetical protein CBS101457_000336 [Exobasidium rhododendri]
MVEAVAHAVPTAMATMASSSRSVPDLAVTRQITSRPARKQITHRDLENLRQSNDKANQTGLSYNIWYNKWSGGDREDGGSNKTKAANRVVISRDSGYTRANQQGAAFICLFFSRGYCPNGPDCTFLHQLPTDQPDQGHDIFGRGKHGGYRDDMGGVGSIQTVNRTLYVGRITEESDNAARMGSDQFGNGGKGWNFTMRKDQMSQTERVLHRHFSEFGELERVRILHTRGCGFVTFVKEVNAQFAKEAMMNQSLDHDECINLRWASDDPNPIAIKRNKREREEQGMSAIEQSMTEEQKDAGRLLRELENGGEVEGEDESKKRRIEGASSVPEMSEEEYQKLLEENQRNWDEMEREDAAAQEAAWAAIEMQEKEAKEKAAAALPKSSILTPAAMEAIQAMRRQKAAPQAEKVIPVSALGGLADYGSDSEEEGGEE